jgi:hypothetical protein
MIELFELENGKVTLTKHCYSLRSLKMVIDEYPEYNDHEKVFRYIYYMTCPDPKKNPFFNLPEGAKEDVILKEVEANFSLDSTAIATALKFCEKLYETPTKRMFYAYKRTVEKTVQYLEKMQVKDGEDGNLDMILNLGSKVEKMMASYRNTYNDFADEQKQHRARGNQDLAYDQQNML